MASIPHLDALLAPLRADVVSGAAVVGRLAARVTRRAVQRLPAESPAELRRGLVELAHRVLDAQPSMAPLVSLMSAVLEAADGAGDVDEARRCVSAAVDAFREGLETRGRVVAARGAALLPDGARVLTLSSSSTVRGALTHGSGGRGLHAVCLESRPLQEGRLLAEALAAAGVGVTLAVDAAAATLARGCDLVLLGADSIGDEGLVNKVGSLAAVDAARRAGIPVHVLTDETKILPPGFPQHVDDDRPGEEVAPPARGVRVWNRYFETIPLGEVHDVVTESATLRPAEVEAMRGGIGVPPELAAWARLRAAPPAPDPL